MTSTHKLQYVLLLFILWYLILIYFLNFCFSYLYFLLILGMRPVVYSCVDAGTRGIGWIRSGSDISYYSNLHHRNNSSGEGNSQYYTLSFTIEFRHSKDTVLIAYSYPYSVADYRLHIKEILSRPNAVDIIISSKLCTSLGGESCDLLAISNYKVSTVFKHQIL